MRPVRAHSDKQRAPASTPGAGVSTGAGRVFATLLKLRVIHALRPHKKIGHSPRQQTGRLDSPTASPVCDFCNAPEFFHDAHSVTLIYCFDVTTLQQAIGGVVMKSSVVKRSVVIAGHKTSVSLED